MLPPGTPINGTILFAQKAPDKYSRPRIVLDFSNVLHKAGGKSPLYAHVLNVDNARETVRNNEILGIIQPHASSKFGIAMAAIGATNPIAGYTLKSVQTVYGLSIRREIQFPAGTDMQIQIVRPSMLKAERRMDRMAASGCGCTSSATGRSGAVAHRDSEQEAFGPHQSDVPGRARAVDGGVWRSRMVCPG